MNTKNLNLETKGLLALIICLGLSFFAFSQKEITLKDVIKNSATSEGIVSNKITAIKIKTTLPVTIGKGKENAIFLTGEMTENERKQIKNFCDLRDGILSLSDPYLYLDDKMKNKDFSQFKIRIELIEDISTFFLNKDAYLVLQKGIIADNGIINLNENSKMEIEEEVNLGVLMLKMGLNSSIKFDTINTNELILNMDDSAKVELNGKVKSIVVSKQGRDAKILGNYIFGSLEGEFDLDMMEVKDISQILKNMKMDNEDNIIISSEDTIDLKREEKDKVNKNKDCTYSDNPTILDVSPYLGYGFLNLGNKFNNFDDFYSTPSNQYSLKHSTSWSFGLVANYYFLKSFTLQIGLGYESDIFRFINNVNAVKENNDIRITYDTNSFSNIETKLVARYITIPLQLKWNVYKHFSINAGCTFGFNFNTSSTGFKRDYKLNGIEINERWGRAYNNFNPIKLDLQVGIGYRGFNMFLKHSLTSLFRNGKEMSLYPFSFGFSYGL